MGVIASGCRIAWHMGPFGGVFWYRTGCTVSHAPFVLAPGHLRHLLCRKGTTRLQVLLSGSEGGRGRETTPPKVVNLLNPFGPAGANTPPGSPPARLLQKYKIGPRHSSFC